MSQAPRRIVIAGGSGCGKTTLARRIAEILHIDHTEIDGLYHGPNWRKRPTFQADVEAFTSGSVWVTEWQYSSVRELLASRATLMVWLDLPISLQMWRVTKRTVTRRLRRQELWNGNVEPPLWTIFTDRDHIIRWAWRTRNERRAEIPHLPQRHPQLRIVRLRSQRDVDAWLKVLATDT